MMIDTCRSAVRSLRRAPYFFAISTLSLGVALGLSTTVIALVDSVRNPVNPYIDPDNTVGIQYWGARDPVHPGASADDFRTALRRITAFDEITEYGIQFDRIGGTGDSHASAIAIVQPNFFDVTRVHPQLGRLLGKNDFTTGNAVVVSDELWRQLYKTKSTLNGDRVEIAGIMYTIVGVLPPHAHHAGPFSADAWRPEVPADKSGAEHRGHAGGWFSGHLRSGVTVAAAENQLKNLASQLTQTFGVGARPYGFKLHSLRLSAGPLKFMQFLLASVAVCILFISCANIATLMLARAAARRRELALRLALGSSIRALVAGQFLEVALIAVAGGLTGLVVAFWGIAAAMHTVPAEMRDLQLLDPHWSWRFFAITLTMIAIVIVGIGMIPAWQVTRVQPMEPLKDGSGNTTRRSARGLKLIVVAQVAVTLVLLFGATLLTRSSRLLASTQRGFDPRPLLDVRGNFVYRQNININHFADAAAGMLPRVRGIEGVVSATTIATASPLKNVVYSDETTGRGITPLLVPTYTIIGAHYFRTMGIPLIEGHDVDDGDVGTGVVILDERAAHVLFPNGHAVGHNVKFGPPESEAPWVRVIGVAKTADMSTADAIDGPKWLPVYASVPHQDERAWRIIARVDGDVSAVSVRVNRELNASLPMNAPAMVTSWAADLDRDMRFTFFLSNLFVVLGILALLASAAGLFAVMAYTVAQRMREFGVRVALGAQDNDVFRIVLKDAAEIVLGGTALGAFIGFIATKFIEGSLSGLGPTDPVSLIVAETILLFVMCAACVAPALHATRADPLDVIRST